MRFDYSNIGVVRMDCVYLWVHLGGHNFIIREHEVIAKMGLLPRGTGLQICSFGEKVPIDSCFGIHIERR
jgi:hypothetical protein